MVNRVSKDVPEVRNDHEEADTKIAYIINHTKRKIGDREDTRNLAGYEEQ